MIACVACSTEHKCSACGAYFATVDVNPLDSRPDCTYCLECWQERITNTCASGHHGTPERIDAWTYSGSCTGMVKTFAGQTYPCICSCHEPAA